LNFSLVLAGLKLLPLPGSGKAWCYSTMDFDGEKVTDEFFCVQFNKEERFI
jgi:hypothetical protein